MPWHIRSPRPRSMPRTWCAATRRFRAAGIRLNRCSLLRLFQGGQRSLIMTTPPPPHRTRATAMQAASTRSPIIPRASSPLSAPPPARRAVTRHILLRMLAAPMVAAVGTCLWRTWDPWITPPRRSLKTAVLHRAASRAAPGTPAAAAALNLHKRRSRRLLHRRFSRWSHRSHGWCGMRARSAGGWPISLCLRGQCGIQC